MKDANTTTASSVSGLMPSLSTSALATVAPTFAPTAIVAAVVDGKYSEARTFAGEFAQRGVLAFDTGGDIARLWESSLKPLLEERPQARIAGFTPETDFDEIRRLAADNSLSVLLEGRHESGPARTRSHIVYAGLRSHDFAWMLREAGSIWPPALAHTILGASLTGEGRHEETIVSVGNKAPDNPGLFVSWVIG